MVICFGYTGDVCQTFFFNTGPDDWREKTIIFIHPHTYTQYTYISIGRQQNAGIGRNNFKNAPAYEKNI